MDERGELELGNVNRRPSRRGRETPAAGRGKPKNQKTKKPKNQRRTRARARLQLRVVRLLHPRRDVLHLLQERLHERVVRSRRVHLRARELADGRAHLKRGAESRVRAAAARGAARKRRRLALGVVRARGRGEVRGHAADDGGIRDALELLPELPLRRARRRHRVEVRRGVVPDVLRAVAQELRAAHELEELVVVSVEVSQGARVSRRELRGRRVRGDGGTAARRGHRARGRAHDVVVVSRRRARRCGRGGGRAAGGEGGLLFGALREAPRRLARGKSAPGRGSGHRGTVSTKNNIISVRELTSPPAGAAQRIAPRTSRRPLVTDTQLARGCPGATPRAGTTRS